MAGAPVTGNVADATRQGGGLRPGLIANYVAFGVVAVTGLALNFVVLAAAGSDGLGVFSQTYVLFFVLAQPAALGIHHAVLQRVSHRPVDEARATLRAGLGAVVPIAAAVATLGLFAAPLLADLFDSAPMEESLRWAVLGLPFHAANKVAIGFTNALGRMRRFALFQGARAVLFTLAVVALTAADDAPKLALAFPLAEAALAVVVVVTLPRPATTWPAVPRRSLVAFGRRSAIGGLMQEIGARVDIVVLGLLVSDEDVGVFAIAATLIEGCYQLLVVLRNNVNPLIAASVAGGRTAAVVDAAAHIRRRVVPVAVASWVAVVLAARPVLSAVDDELERAYWPLVIMLGCLVAVSAFVPFDQILLLGGRPTAQSLLMLVVVAVNVVVIAVLVPIIGLVGAGIGTGSGFVTLGLITLVTARRMLGVDLLGRQPIDTFATPNQRE